MRNKILLGILVCVSILFMVFGSVVYYRRLNETLNESIVQNMTEMSEHDVNNIQNTLENSWSDLQSMGRRLKEYASTNKFDTKEAVQVYLNIERKATIFDRIRLIDSEGTYYTDDFQSGNGASLGYVQDVLNQSISKFIRWYYETDENNIDRQKLLYGVDIDDVEIDGIRFVGIVGITNIQAIAASLEINSFDGQGNSVLIDSEGYFIAGQNNLTSNPGSNYFDWLRQGSLSKEEENRTIRRIQNEENFTIKYVNATDETKLVTFTHVADTDWCLILNIPMSVLTKQSNGFLSMTILILMVMILAFLILLSTSFFLWSNFRYAKVESKVKGEFLSNMSHEIRTPLNGLIGLNHLMKKNVDNPEKMQEYLQKSDVTANYLLTLINDILDFSKLQEGKVELFHKPFDLKLSLESINIMFEDRMKQKNLTFETEQNLSYEYLIGDEMRLKQILINIIGNSVKFTPEGGTIRLSVSQTMAENQVQTTYVISDNGIGMSKEFLPKIFESFAQEGNEFSQANQGTGLGMPITYLLVQKMGGTISVESELNQGTTFTVMIPSPIASKESIPNPALSSAWTPSSKQLHIMVAEDNELNAEIMQDILTTEGFKVTMAENGQVAVDLFKNSKINEFDVILMDGQMPVMNGFEASQAIRNLPREDAKKIRIFACTANTLADEREQALQHGMNGLIPKPIDVKELLKLLNQK